MTIVRRRSKEAAWLSKQADFTTGINADETELTALRFLSVNMEEGLRDDKRAGAINDALAGAKPQWLERTSKIEEETGRIAEEVRRRQLLLGDSYPFIVSGNTLTYRKSRTGVYEFCLCATLTKSLKEKPLRDRVHARTSNATAPDRRGTRRPSCSASARRSRSHASWTASSASLTEPRIR